jgi:hypothetical protein
LFFDAVRDQSSLQYEWYKGLKTKIQREISQRDLYGKETLDQTPNEIFLVQIKGMSAALARADHAEAAMRKLCIKTAWRCAGRGGESGFISYGGLKWNDMHGTTVVEAPQSKSSKLKFVPFVAGADRHSDWLLDFADYLVFLRGSISWNQPEGGDGDKKKCWLLPEMASAGASTKLAGYMKALQPAPRVGAQVKYAPFASPWMVDGAMHDLPPQPTAAGIRPGAADTLAASVPAELAVHTTGHDLTHLSALWEYLHARVTLCVPGAIVLSGWPALPYGQNGKGPAHPSLVVLISGGVAIEFLESLANKVFSLHDGSPPMLLQGGPTRKIIHAALATLIMYYAERFKAKEMHTVLHQMRESYEELATPDDDAHAVFVKWGSVIKEQFVVDNLHLSTRQGHGEMEQLVAAVGSLKGMLNSLLTTTSDIASRVIGLEERLGRMEGQGNAAASPIPVPTPQRSAAPARATSQPAASPPAASPPAASSKPTLQFSSVGGLTEYKTAKVLGGQFYLDCMAINGNLVAVNDRCPTPHTPRPSMCTHACGVLL